MAQWLLRPVRVDLRVGPSFRFKTERHDFVLRPSFRLQLLVEVYLQPHGTRIGAVAKACDIDRSVVPLIAGSSTVAVEPLMHRLRGALQPLPGYFAHT